MKKLLPLVIVTVFCGASLILPSLWRVSAADCTQTSMGLVPLNDLGAGIYKGAQGGLYPNGSNVRPEAHESNGIQLARAIRPLDANGQANANGKIVFLSIGMSNTTQEFSTFMPMAEADAQKNPNLVLVDGAQGSQGADYWANPNDNTWSVVADRLSAASVTARQVQAVWLKLQFNGDAIPSFPSDAARLRDTLGDIVRIAKSKYPNLRVLYLSSRSYGGYNGVRRGTGAYESGFAVKWLIEDQINGDARLAYTGNAPVAPWLAWGPYLWADGLTPRSDGLTYACSDFNSDGIHPSTSGRQKIANLLLNFFKSDSTTRLWFLNSATSQTPALLTEENSTRAIALDSVTMMRDPFPVATVYNFSPDGRTRVMLFATNLELLPGENASAVTVQWEDAQRRTYALPVEYVGRVPGFDWLTQLIVKLPDELESAGDVWVSINLHGAISNRALISIKPSVGSP